MQFGVLIQVLFGEGRGGVTGSEGILAGFESYKGD